MTKQVLYYTDNRLAEPIFSVCQRFIVESGLPIVSVSLKPLDFGQNIVVKGRDPSYPTMVLQILTGLQASTADYVSLAEHDVLYSPSHWDFTPPRDDTYYYNYNCVRWDYPTDRVVSYQELTSLSQLCASRTLLLGHYTARWAWIQERELEDSVGEPGWARKLGYEPGLKKTRNGGFKDEPSGRFRSELPNVDIRHPGTYSPPKVTLDSFKHPPTGWMESTIDEVPGWDLRELFFL